MSTEITAFDYGQLDAPVAEFLRTKERNMRDIVGKAYTDLGRELKEAQDALARQGSKYDGVFERWYTQIGWKKEQVYRMIRRYNLVTNCDEVSRQLLEDIPVSLAYEIAAPSADSTEAKRTAKAAVLNGDITTLREYRAMVERYEAERERAEKAEEQARKYAEDYEVVRDTLESMTQSYEGHVPNELEVAQVAARFSESVRTIVGEFSYLEHYVTEFKYAKEAVRREYQTSLDALYDFVDKLSGALGKSDVTIIDI